MRNCLLCLSDIWERRACGRLFLKSRLSGAVLGKAGLAAKSRSTAAAWAGLGEAEKRPFVEEAAEARRRLRQWKDNLRAQVPPSRLSVFLRIRGCNRIRGRRTSLHSSSPKRPSPSPRRFRFSPHSLQRDLLFG